MADLVFNISLGQTVSLYQRIKDNDPANSAFIVVLGLGAITDATLRDLDTLAAIEANGGFSESVDGSYARKIITDTELVADPGPDDANDRYDLDIPNQTFTGMSGESLTRLLICYDADTTGGTDANIIPVCFYDFVVTTDGSDITAQIDAAGFFRASG